jgi:N-acetylneuraminic acid mutarotase
MAYLGGDRVLVFGGWNTRIYQYCNDSWIYDLSENIWMDVTSINAPSPRGSFAMTYIGGGQVMLFGGMALDTYGKPSLNDETWIFDGRDNTWTFVGELHEKPSARWGAAMAAAGHQVLMFGGENSNILDETWYYQRVEIK